VTNWIESPGDIVPVVDPIGGARAALVWETDPGVWFWQSSGVERMRMMRVEMMWDRIEDLRGGNTG
jgi:hypothetical protein